MNKPLLISLAAATILTSSAGAQSMYDRIQTMELQMKQMEKELTTLKSTKSETLAEDEEEVVADDNEAISDLEEDEEADMEAGDEEDEEEDEDEETLDERVDDLEESVTDLNKNTNGSHLKFGVDYRFAVDNLQYKMAGKDASGSDTKGNDALLTNRLWINMNWKATDNLSFTGQLAYNKTFGARSGTGYAPFETFDWIASENAYDDVVRVRSAYFLYKDDNFLGEDVWTFSIGRRPSTNGHLVNLRDDDVAASPMGHTINVEFDGLSAKFGFSEITGIDGMYVKFCAGRGGTNANPKFFSIDPATSALIASGAPYDTNGNDTPDIDLGGLIFVPYNDGQYGVATQYYYANNLIDANLGLGQTLQGMKTVGGLHSVTANFTMNGIGDEWSDYLDDTFFFVSGAVSITDPKADQRMLYGQFNFDGTENATGQSKTGYSIWAGLQMPSLATEDGRWGIEYNQGSEYWRSITYAEDTNIGSKLATRGDAYEVYFTEPLVEDILSLQIRYTYIDYAYTGSNGFFGDTTGASYKITDVQDAAAGTGPFAAGSAGLAAQTPDTAQDIRVYLRYRY